MSCRQCRRLFQLLSVTLGLLLLASPAFPQAQVTGRILGTVTDQSGGAIVGATVVITDVERGTTRRLTTDNAGAYLAPNLIAGTYSVRVEFGGFSPYERPLVGVRVGADTTLDIVLQPGAQTETITVTEELPLIDTQSATLGGTLSNDVIVDLPIAGRNYQNLMELRPGVVAQLGNNSNGGGPNAVNGLRAESSSAYAVEGVLGIDPYTGQSVINNIGVNGDAASILSTDAIQEYNQQFNPKAESGFKAGSTVAVGLKSGTNTFHGSGYGYFRNDALDARNKFNTTDQDKVNMDMKQFGGTFGGPIVQDRMFFFMAYEQQLVNYGNPNNVDAPFTDPAMLSCTGAGTSSFDCSPIPGAGPEGSEVLPTDHLILACLAVRDDADFPGVSARSAAVAGMDTNCNPISGYPSPSGLGFLAHGATDHGAEVLGGRNTNYYPNAQTHVLSLGSLAKVDLTAADNHFLNGFLFWGEGDREDGLSGGGAPNPLWRTNFVQHSKMIAGSWTWLVSPAVVNTFRVGWSLLDQPSHSLDTLPENSPEAIGIPTGVTDPRNFGMPDVGISGFYGWGGRQTETQGPGKVLEITDSVSYLIGSHSLRFGGGIMNQSFGPGGIFLSGKGEFSFGTGGGSPGVAAYFAGQSGIGSDVAAALGIDPTSSGLEEATRLYGDPTAESLRKTFSLFVQDDWRVTPRLTLNLGVRYDYSTPLHENDSFLGSFDENFGLIQEGFHVPRIYNGDNDDFSPRAGFAWDIFGTGTTVLRGSGALTYELITLRSFLEVGNDLGLAGIPTAFVIGCSSPIVDRECPEGNFVTSGGSRAVGAVTYSRTDGTLSGIDWEASGGDTIFPTGAVQNCNPFMDVNGFEGTPCNVGAVDRNLKSPYVTSWNLSLQHAFTPGLVLDVAYVGNHGSELLGKTNPNQPPLASGWSDAETAAERVADAQAACNTAYQGFLAETVSFGSFQGACGRRPSSSLLEAARPFAEKFPYLNVITKMGNYDWSNYNALQASLSLRNFHGFSGLMGYTWSHALEVSSNNNSGLGTDSYNRALDYGGGSNDLRHRLTLGLSYQLPESQMAGGVLGGWRISANFKAQSGQNGTMSFNRSFQGTNRNTSRFNVVGELDDVHVDPLNEDVPIRFDPLEDPTDTSASIGVNNTTCLANAVSEATLAAFGCVIQGSFVATPPAVGTFGNHKKGTISSQKPYTNIDLSFAKMQTVTERLSAEFRIDIYNPTNTPHYDNVTTAINSGNYYVTRRTSDVGSNNPYLGSGGGRRFELGLKLIF